MRRSLLLSKVLSKVQYETRTFESNLRMRSYHTILPRLSLRIQVRLHGPTEKVWFVKKLVIMIIIRSRESSPN